MTEYHHHNYGDTQTDNICRFPGIPRVSIRSNTISSPPNYARHNVCDRLIIGATAISVRWWWIFHLSVNYRTKLFNTWYLEYDWICLSFSYPAMNQFLTHLFIIRYQNIQLFYNIIFNCHHLAALWTTEIVFVFTNWSWPDSII